MIGFQDAQNFYQTLFFNREIRCRFSFIEPSCFLLHLWKIIFSFIERNTFSTKKFLHRGMGNRRKKKMRMIGFQRNSMLLFIHRVFIFSFIYEKLMTVIGYSYLWNEILSLRKNSFIEEWIICMHRDEKRSFRASLVARTQGASIIHEAGFLKRVRARVEEPTRVIA